MFSSIITRSLLVASVFAPAAGFAATRTLCDFNTCRAIIVGCDEPALGGGKGCHDIMVIRCGRESVFHGPYTVSSEPGSVTYTAGNPSPIGAPRITHEVTQSSTAEAMLTIGDINYRGTCQIRDGSETN